MSVTFPETANHTVTILEPASPHAIHTSGLLVRRSLRVRVNTERGTKFVYPGMQLAIMIVLTVADISPSPYKTTSEYPTDAWLAPVTVASFGQFPCDTNSAYQAERAGVTPGFPSSVMATDIPSVASVDPSSTSPANTAIVQVPLSSSFPSSWGDSIPPGDCDWYGSMVVGQGSKEDHHSPSSLPGGLGFDGNLAIPPGLGIGAPTAKAMDVRPGHYGANYRDGSIQRPLSKRQKSERSTGQPVGKGGPHQRFTCMFDGCGKDFSGEWEKKRHVRALHGLPTIGCRECNYKHSRMDQFIEHCRKRHPGKSIEGLKVDLPTPE